MIKLFNDKTFLLLFGFSRTDASLKALGQGKRITGKKYTREKDVSARLKKWLETPGKLCSDFSISDLASDIDVAENTLRKYFRKKYQKSYIQWKMNVRIQEANEILANDPDRTVTSIAKELGFEDKSNFHRQFRRVTGYTPKKWISASDGL